MIIREPRTVEWAKPSIEKKISNSSLVGSGRVGSDRVSNLELGDNKRAPEPRRVGQGVDQKKKLFFQCKLTLGSNLELDDNKRAPEPRQVG